MKRKLTKSRSDIVVTGVLGGFSDYFGIDSTILRVIAVILTFMGVGSTIPVYIILAMIMPSPQRAEQGRSYGNYQESRTRHSGKRKEAEKIDDDDWSDF